MNGIPDPSACGWCDHGARDHEQARLLGHDRPHGYMPPSQKQILYRMTQRRLARLLAKMPKAYVAPAADLIHAITAEDKLTPAIKAVAANLDFLQWADEMKRDDHA